MYCHSMHYHQCAVYNDAAATEQSRTVPRHLSTTSDNVVNTSYAVSQHYRPCSTQSNARPCDKLLASATYVDDTVLRYRPQLIENVRRVLDLLD